MDIKNDYFEWIYETLDGGRHGSMSFRKLIECLHTIEFTYFIPRDEDRAADGIDLRYSYSYHFGMERVPSELVGPPSVLEVITALAMRCEEEIMEDPDVGDRTAQWFWGMMKSLGLNGMTDNRFDECYVRDVVQIFLDREYEPNGRGGLFTINNCDYDLREVEIWYQMCWYLNTIV